MFSSSPEKCEEETETCSLSHNNSLQKDNKTLKKSLRSVSRSTFDSIIDDYIEDDWEKRSALGVSVTVVVILTSFLALLFAALSISLGVQHGNQSRKIAFTICTKEWELSNSVNILKHFEILCVFPCYVSVCLVGISQC